MNDVYKYIIKECLRNKLDPLSFHPFVALPFSHLVPITLALSSHYCYLSLTLFLNHFLSLTMCLCHPLSNIVSFFISLLVNISPSHSLPYSLFPPLPLCLPLSSSIPLYFLLRSPMSHSLSCNQTPYLSLYCSHFLSLALGIFLTY